MGCRPENRKWKWETSVSAPKSRDDRQACRFDLRISIGRSLSKIPRKEVIQPQVPLRLPCYDFTPVTDRSLVGPSPCGLRFLLLEQPTPMV